MNAEEIIKKWAKGKKINQGEMRQLVSERYANFKADTFSRTMVLNEKGYRLYLENLTA